MRVTPCQDTVRRRRVTEGVAQMITPMVSIQRRITMQQNDIHALEPEDNQELTQEEKEDFTEYTIPQNGSVSYKSEDIDVYGLVRRVNKGKIFIPRFNEDKTEDGPNGFQREFVWTTRQVDRFIESILCNYPTPGIFLVTLKNNNRAVLDGQQRLISLSRFLDGKHRIGQYPRDKAGETLVKLSGKLFEQLDESDKTAIEDYTIQVTTLETSPRGDIDAIYNIYERINSGGTPLTSHEIRVALFAGPVVEKISELNEYENWRKIYGKKPKRMRDHELISRILCFYKNYEEYKKPLKKAFNGFYNDESTSNLSGIAESEILFKQACDVIVDSGISHSALRPRGSISVVWFDSLMVSLMRKIKESDQDEIDALTESFSDYYTKYRESFEGPAGEEKFIELFTGPTADTANLKHRFAYAITNLFKDESE